MSFNGWSILGGLVLLFVMSYGLITAFTYLFIRYAMKDKMKFKKLLALSIAALAWVASTLVSFMLTSSFGAVAFAVTSAIIIFGSLYYISKKFLSIDGKPKIVYSVSLAVILNPAWLFVLGILS